jgi:hypothetical protein
MPLHGAKFPKIPNRSVALPVQKQIPSVYAKIWGLCSLRCLLFRKQKETENDRILTNSRFWGVRDFSLPGFELFRDIPGAKSRIKKS